MKKLMTIIGIAAAFALLFLFDIVSLGLVQETEAIAGVRRRTARRTAVIVGSSSSAAVASANAQTAAAQQEAAAAQQQAAAAQAEADVYKQQAAAAQQPAAAPAPTAMVASLPEGCVSAGEVFQCGNVYYKPYMAGNQIVYGVVPGP
jgi:hypothetical protein